MKLALLIALAVATAGCSSPFGANEARELATARAQWDQRDFADYTFEARHDCFCMPEQVGPVRITVRQGTIESVTLLETGQAVNAAYWFTIEDLFDQIPLWAKQDDVEDVSVDYDAGLGFPSSVEVRYEEGILDAGHTYTVSAVAPA